MKEPVGPLGHIPSPFHVFVRVLIIFFLTEGGIMLLLPGLLGAASPAVTSIVDAVLLMVLSAPFLWFAAIRPLRGAALREQMRAATVVAHARDGIVTINHRGLVESFNPAAERLFGYAAHEVLGRPATVLMPERHRADHRRGLEKQAGANASRDSERVFEVRGLRKDGREFPMELSLATWNAREGTFHTAVVRDITDRKQAEEVLRARTSQLEAVRAVAAEITRELKQGSLLSLITRLAAELLGVARASVWLWDEATQSLAPRTWHGFGDGFKAVELQFGAAFARTVAQQRRGAIIDSSWASPQAFGELSEALGTRALLLQPLFCRDRLLGAIVLCNPGASRPFADQDLEMLGLFAHQAAIAIENARLYEEVQSLAVVQERQRLAREMHDSVAQSLALLHLQLRRAQEAHAVSDSRLGAVLAEMAATTEHAYEELRQSISALRAVTSRAVGWIPTLTEYLREFSTRTGIQVMLEAADELPDRLAPATEVQLVRIIQEALVNVHKHAGADRARVRLAAEERGVRVTIEDDGRGFQPDAVDASKRGHFGLATMRERAEGLGGKLDVDSAPGRGTRIVAMFPGGE